MQLELNTHQRFDPIFSDLKPELVEKFFEYHQRRPEVYVLFEKFAYEARRRWNHFGSMAIINRIRWETNLEYDSDNFKISNNCAPCYARLLMLNDPSFKGFFRTRETPGTVSEGY